ncbi:hypothetical protein SAE02_01750 [Skermanella aerolata]|uniref:SWF/SNF family helicase n=1 Tax=Skermanella aerolata TaxID=393310 RepID=A0A512DHR9_9PROT|nr:DEAD/DEAH box helicase [Skermanella aerolata]GEO36027.1 hypothetical protein SAE02_01750 [Skermanella aerolata]
MPQNSLTPPTVAPTSTDDDRSIAHYEALAPCAKIVAHLKAIAGPYVEKDGLLTVATVAKLTLPDGTALNPQVLGESIGQLKRNGLWNRLGEAHSQVRHHINIAALEDPRSDLYLKANQAAERRSIYQFSNHYESAGARQLRLAIYLNDDEFITDYTDKEPAETWNRLTQFFGLLVLEPQWLESRAPVIREAILMAKLLSFLYYGAPPADFPAFLGQLRDLERTTLTPAALIILAKFETLSGSPARTALLLSRLRELAEADDTGKATDHAVLMASAIEHIAAMVDFLSGRNAEALGRFREALRLFRKATHKRKIFLPDIQGLLASLCLLREGDPSLMRELGSWLNDADRDSGFNPNYIGFWAIRVLSAIARGNDREAELTLAAMAKSLHRTPLSRMLEDLAEFMLDRKRTGKRAGELHDLFVRYKGSLPLVAETYAAMLEKVSDAPEPYLDFLDRRDREPIILLTDVMQVDEPWQRALDHLQTLLVAPSKPEEPAKKKGKRLIWLVDPDIGTIEPVEQTSKRDGWNTGRALSFRRVIKNDPPLEVDEDDRRVIDSLHHGFERSIYGYSVNEVYGPDPNKTLLALAGHPRVFDANDRNRQLELVRYPVELVISEARGGYRIALSHFADAPTVFLEPETRDRYRVIEVPLDVVRVGALLGPDGMTVPRDGREKIIAMVRKSMGGSLPIRSEIDAVDVPAIEGSPTPVLRLVPIDRGLRVSAFVRPFGEDGPHYLPGHAGKSVLALIDGKTQRANRDLEREKAELATLVASCPSLAERALGDLDWELPDLFDSLEFLSEVQAYDGPVQLEWPEEGRIRVTAMTSAESMSVKLRAARDWFQVSGELRIDENLVMDLRELLERAGRTQGRFIQLDDGRFLAMTEQLRRQLDRLGSLTEGDGKGRRVHRMAASAVEEALEGAGKLDSDKQWREQIEKIRAAGRHEPKVPSTLQAELRDYQAEGFRWLSRLAHWGAGACLADDMGLGKTVQAIAVMLEHAPRGAIIVVAPTSVCHNWAAEIERFAPPLRVHQFANAGDRAVLVKSLGPMDVLVTSYGLLNLESALLSETPWQIAVLDEAQAIKNAATKRAQASMMLQAEFRLALTGTPVENYLEELWSLFHFINPGLLGSLESFRKRFALPIERGDRAARQSLKALVGPFILRRTKSAVLTELPERTEQTILVDLDDDERALYEALRRRAIERIENLPGEAAGQRKIHILAEITRLRRACCHPSLAAPEASGMEGAKLSLFLELVDELLRNRHKALVFSQYVGFLDIVRKALDERGIAYKYLDGQTPAREREKQVNAFQAGEGDLFLISLKAGGTGLNLTAADYVIHLDPWWNPAVEDQASGRAHRIGQQRPVTIYRLAVAGTIEQGILGLHKDKRQMAAELLDGSEASAKLSDEELIGLLRG